MISQDYTHPLLCFCYRSKVTPLFRHLTDKSNRNQLYFEIQTKRFVKSTLSVCKLHTLS